MTALCRALRAAGFDVVSTEPRTDLTDAAITLSPTLHVSIHGPRSYSVVREVSGPDSRVLFEFSAILTSSKAVVSYLQSVQQEV